MGVYMLDDRVLNYCVYNGRLYKNSEIKSFPNKGVVIYEVIRVLNGNLMFLKEHIDRIKNSFFLNNIKIELNYTELENSIKMVIKENNIINNNIKIIINISDKTDYIVYPIVSKYPSEDMYEKGVEVGILKAVRENPNVKVLNYDFKKSISKKLSDENLYEVLLVNDKGNVTEGSRSNVFFIKENVVISPPADAVLKGITRMKTIEILKNNQIEFIEREVSEDEIEKFDGAFLTGTSINALPIYKINDSVFNTSKLKIYLKIRKEFSNIIGNL